MCAYPCSLVLTARHRKILLQDSHYGSDLHGNQLPARISTPLITLDLFVCLSFMNVIKKKSPWSPQYKCVSFTARWSYSNIHTHLEIQMAKHSTQSWCKLQKWVTSEVRMWVLTGPELSRPSWWDQNTIQNNWQCLWSSVLLWQPVASFTLMRATVTSDSKCEMWHKHSAAHWNTHPPALAAGFKLWTQRCQSVWKCRVCTDVTLSMTPPSCYRQDTDTRQINHSRIQSCAIRETVTNFKRQGSHLDA